MTDRELLELAAKAECRNWLSYHHTKGMCCRDDRHGGLIEYYWNPLTDDGDAFKLAISCGLSIDPYPYYDTPKHSVIVKQRRRGGQMRETNPTEVVEIYGDNPASATRRAIVRAAASIGQQMEK